MTRCTLRLVPLVVLALVLLYPSRADARRGGIIVITHGEVVKHVGDVVDDLKAEVREATGSAAVPSVGFVYSAFGVFWLDFWTWDGKYCLYSGDTYWDLDPEQSAELLGISQSELSKPFVYTCPPGLLVVLGIGALVAGNTWRQRSRIRAYHDKLRALLEDSRYRGALKILQDHYAHRPETTPATEAPQDGHDERAENQQPAPDAADSQDESVSETEDAVFEKAIQHLVDQGIDRQEAQTNLGMLMAASTTSTADTE